MPKPTFEFEDEDMDFDRLNPSTFKDETGISLRQNTFLQNIGVTFKLLISRDMLPVNLQLIWAGCSISYWSTMLTPIMTLQLPEENENRQLQLALFGMVAFGFGEVSGGLVHGWLIDR